LPIFSGQYRKIADLPLRLSLREFISHDYMNKTEAQLSVNIPQNVQNTTAECNLKCKSSSNAKCYRYIL